MSKLLRRAIKISIWPAILMIAAKFIGLVAVSYFSGKSLNMDNQNEGFFSIQLYFTDEKTTLFVNSYSNLIMLLVIAIPTFLQIFKTSLYQTTLQDPRTIVKLTKLNLLSWVTKDDTCLLQIFIWDVFLILASAITIGNAFQGTCYDWIGVLAGLLTLFSILFSIKSFEREISRVYPKEQHYF